MIPEGPPAEEADGEPAKPSAGDLLLEIIPLDPAVHAENGVPRGDVDPEAVDPADPAAAARANTGIVRGFGAGSPEMGVRSVCHHERSSSIKLIESGRKGILSVCSAPECRDDVLVVPGRVAFYRRCQGVFH
jgi:hypothetical protein